MSTYSGTDVLLQEIDDSLSVVLQNYHEEFIVSLSKYLPTLKRKYNQLIYKDDYGDIIYSGWRNECNYFVETKLSDFTEKILAQSKKRLEDFLIRERYIGGDFEISVNKIIRAKTEIALTDKLDQHIRSSTELDAPTEKGINLTDPILFERSIKETFERLGWRAMQTSASGDQGADVIAEKGNNIIIIQCKLYSQPVGNKAVQEAYSAKQFYNGSHALVITNATFTKSARQLAGSCDVHLMHHEELEDFIIRSSTV